MTTSQIVLTAISAFGGIALFLYGMNVLGSGLEKSTGGKMEKILEKLTGNIVKAVILGAIVTAVIQSSSATTVIVVGLVNSGVLKLKSAVGIIMGANIGTTVTGQILRLGGGDSSVGTAMEFFSTDTLAPALAILGILIVFIGKNDTIKAIGDIAMGLGVLFFGMNFLSESVEALSELQAFKNAFSAFNNPVIGILVGTVVTALIQSSSASVGILQAVSDSGMLTFGAAFPIIMGQNIGTTSTSLISSIGASKNAKRASMIHVYFNVIGTILFLSVVYILKYTGVLSEALWQGNVDRGDIANFHALFNIAVTIFFIPFHTLLEKLALWTIRDKADDEDDIISDTSESMLDTRFLKSPSLAIQYSNNAAVYMGKLAKKNFMLSCGLHKEFSSKNVEKIKEYENIIDRIEDKLNAYLVAITDCELSAAESKAVTSLLHIITDFERIGDYSVNIMQTAESMHESDIKLSDMALSELDIISSAIDEIIEMSITAVEYDDVKTVVRIEPLEETIDKLDEELKLRHIERLKTGDCAIERGIKFLDMLSDMERVADHCSNVAVHVLSRNDDKDEVNHHAYIDEIHKGDSKEYADAYEEFGKKYSLL